MKNHPNIDQYGMQELAVNHVYGQLKDAKLADNPHEFQYRCGD
ncbi:hypothetical protein [Salmonirosea aquatica]